MAVHHADTYIVYLRGLNLSVSMGIHDFEQRNRQALIVSAALLLGRPEALKDQIGGVQDYDFLREGVRAMAEGKHYNLQETLCTEILDLCLRQPAILGAVVKTEKPSVYADAAGVGCRMAAFRDESLRGYPWWSIQI